MRRGHQHGVKDYPGLHSWVMKENRKKKDGGRERAAQSSYHKGETLPVHPPAPLPLPHVLQSLWYPSAQLPAAPAETDPSSGRAETSHQSLFTETKRFRQKETKCPHKDTCFEPLQCSPCHHPLFMHFPARATMNPRVASFPNF